MNLFTALKNFSPFYFTSLRYCYSINMTGKSEIWVEAVKVCFNLQQVVFIWYADYFFKMPKSSPLCIYWALTLNKLREPGDMLVIKCALSELVVKNLTFKADSHTCNFQIWWSQMTLSDIMVTCVTKLVVANVTLGFTGHTFHFQIWQS
jgi:hypothetical protein